MKINHRIYIITILCIDGAAAPGGGGAASRHVWRGRWTGCGWCGGDGGGRGRRPWASSARTSPGTQHPNQPQRRCQPLPTSSPNSCCAAALDPVSSASASAPARRAHPPAAAWQSTARRTRLSRSILSRQHRPVGLGTAPARPARPQIARFRSHSFRPDAAPGPRNNAPEIARDRDPHRMNTRPAVMITARARYAHTTVTSRARDSLHDETSLIYPGPPGGGPAKPLLPQRRGAVCRQRASPRQARGSSRSAGGRGVARRRAPLYRRLAPNSSPSPILGGGRTGS